MTNPTAAMLVIGDEILSGRTHDKNIAQVASWLQVQGIRLAEVRVVPDVLEKIVEAVNALREAMKTDPLATERTMYSHILFDENQDLNNAEQELM